MTSTWYISLSLIISQFFKSNHCQQIIICNMTFTKLTDELCILRLSLSYGWTHLQSNIEHICNQTSQKWFKRYIFYQVYNYNACLLSLSTHENNQFLYHMGKLVLPCWWLADEHDEPELHAVIGMLIGVAGICWRPGDLNKGQIHIILSNFVKIYFVRILE